jgi:hypothetical protein
VCLGFMHMVYGNYCILFVCVFVLHLSLCVKAVPRVGRCFDEV